MNIPQPDYDSIKNSLKEHLKALPEYVDVNFDGSTIGTLIDLLAYNTTINTFFLNQVANEAFLRTATQYDSVVANAQDFGYPVSSAKSATARIHVSLAKTSGSPTSTLELPANTIFTTSFGQKTFTFRTLTTEILVNDGANNYRGNITVYEGKQLVHRYVVTQSLLSSGFVIPNKMVDADILKVTVAPSSNQSAKVVYTKSTSIIDGVDSTSKIYFASMDRGALVSIKFGDGIFGVKPSVGDFVEITYLISTGEIPNGAGIFGMTNPPANTAATISVISAASGGSEGETIEEIKFYAPKYFESQGRAVTKSDYQVLIRKLYPNTGDVVVWGGEEVTPKQYGRVFISIKPATGYYLTPTEKQTVYDLIRSFNVATVTPEIVDPEFTYISADTTVTIDRSLSGRSDADIASIVSSAILEFNRTTIGKFSIPLQYSVLSSVIQSSEPSIISTRSIFTVEKRLTPITGTSVDITNSFGTAVRYGSMTSTFFTFNDLSLCKFEEGLPGIIDIVSYSGGPRSVVKVGAGTIDYSTGAFTIPDVYIVSNDSGLVDTSTGRTYLSLTMKSDSQDIDNTNRNILEIVSNTVSVKGA